MTKIEIIEDTVKYYSEDPTRRSTIIDTYGDSRCVYKGPNSKECAFQRVVQDDLSEYDKERVVPSAHTIMIMSEKLLNFKPGYEGHDANFWNDIQRLHDSRYNWTDKGLSDYGVDVVNSLKIKYKDDPIV